MFRQRYHGATGSAGGASEDSIKGEGNQDWNKERKEALTKVVFRDYHPL